MKCKNCGEELPSENSLFCPSCGTKVEVEKPKPVKKEKASEVVVENEDSEVKQIIQQVEDVHAEEYFKKNAKLNYCNEKGSGIAVAAIVLTLISLLMEMIFGFLTDLPLLGIIPKIITLLALIFGIIGVNIYKKDSITGQNKRNLIYSILSIVLSGLIILL